MTSPDPGSTRPFPPEPPPPARASDAEREDTVRTLHDAVGRGLLTLGEGDERVAAAYAARFRDDLPRLTADLPPGPLPAPVAPGWRALLLLVWLQVRSSVTRESLRRAVQSPRRLALAAVALVAVLSLAGFATADSFEHHDHHGHELEQVDDD
jgi:uncharacterized protein DUF1707